MAVSSLRQHRRTTATARVQCSAGWPARVALRPACGHSRPRSAPRDLLLPEDHASPEPPTERAPPSPNLPQPRSPADGCPRALSPPTRPTSGTAGTVSSRGASSAADARVRVRTSSGPLVSEEYQVCCSVDAGVVARRRRTAAVSGAGTAIIIGRKPRRFHVSTSRLWKQPLPRPAREAA